VGLPIHGPGGRIAVVRGWLGLRQRDLAQELVAYGGRASREIVSHWENFDGAGRPRARMRRRNAQALAALAESRGFPVAADLFVEREGTPVELLSRQVGEMDEKLDEMAALLSDLRAEVRLLRDSEPGRRDVRRLASRDSAHERVA
jgi:hypothetical protein